MLFVRPGESRQADGSQFNLDKGEWRYFISKTKTEQAITSLLEPHALTGQGRYVFPGARSRLRPMSEAAINAALRRLGYHAISKDSPDRLAS